MAERNDDGNMNIFQKISKIRKQVEVIQKNAQGTKDFRYVTEDEILAKVSTFMDKYGLILIPKIRSGTFKATPYSYESQKADRMGNMYLKKYNEIITEADMTYEWIDINNPAPENRLSVDWAVIGQHSDASQSFGSGLTYSMRYFLLKFFNIATPEDDPDNWRSKQKDAEKAEDKMIAAQVIKEFDTLVRAYLSEHSDKATDIKELCSKYAKGGDYFAIKDPDAAAKLLKEFKDNFKEE